MFLKEIRSGVAILGDLQSEKSAPYIIIFVYLYFTTRDKLYNKIVKTKITYSVENKKTQQFRVL